jgi:GT2 family glycosyltransferase
MSILSDDRVDAVVGRVRTEGVDRGHLPFPPRDVSATKRAFCFGAFRDDIRLEQISYCAAGHLCLRRHVLAEVGGWDEHILTYGDKDLGLRLHAAGKNLVYDPRPSLTHLAAPAGGTRLIDPLAPWPAWQRAVSIHYLAWRHLRGAEFWRYGMVRAARHTFLLRQNAIRPWRWIPELWGYTRGLAIAWRWSREGVRSSFPA